MTIFKFRDFEHPVSEVNLLSHDMQQTYSNRGHQFRRIEVFTTEVVICTTGQSNFDTELSELRTGYGFDGLAGPPLAGEQAGLFWDDGTPTSHVIDATGSINGIQVLRMNFTGNDGAELATQRTLQITLKAEYPVDSGQFDQNLLEWHNEIQVIGTGGPRFEVYEYEIGPPVVQTTHEFTKGRARQWGHAVMAYGPYMLPAVPQWATFLKHDKTRVGHTSAHHQRNGFENFKTTWYYEFEAPIGFNPVDEPEKR
jgi:hypothetical protein